MKDQGWPHRRFLISEVRNARRNRIIARVFVTFALLYFGGHIFHALIKGPTYPAVFGRSVY